MNMYSLEVQVLRLWNYKLVDKFTSKQVYRVDSFIRRQIKNIGNKLKEQALEY